MNGLIEQETRYNVNEERQFYNQNSRSRNDGQRLPIETIIESLETDDHGCVTSKAFFLQGAAGTGKTFLYRLLASYVRSKGEIAVCMASSVIAAFSFLEERRLTCALTFRLTLPPTQFVVFQVRAIELSYFVRPKSLFGIKSPCSINFVLRLSIKRCGIFDNTLVLFWGASCRVRWRLGAMSLGRAQREPRRDHIGLYAVSSYLG